VRLLGVALATWVPGALSGPAAAAVWPAIVSWQSATPDRTLVGLHEPAFKVVERILLRLRGLQQGHLSTYLFHIVLTVLVLVASVILPLGAGPPR